MYYPSLLAGSILHTVEKRNIVVRIPNHADGRSKLIYLTSKGKEYIKSLIPIAQNTLYEAQENIPKDEMKLCKSILQKVINNLRDGCSDN